MEKSVNLRSMGARQGSRFKLGGMKSRVKTKIKNKGGTVVKHCCVESNPSSGGRVNWMECLSSQLAISNYSVSKWMETVGREGWLGLSRADGAINEPIG